MGQTFLDRSTTRPTNPQRAPPPKVRLSSLLAMDPMQTPERTSTMGRPATPHHAQEKFYLEFLRNSVHTAGCYFMHLLHLPTKVHDKYKVFLIYNLELYFTAQYFFKSPLIQYLNLQNKKICKVNVLDSFN